MADLGRNFYKKLLEVSESVGMPPENLLNVMALESGVNPKASHGSGSAVGLVQILPKYLSNLGYSGSGEDFLNEPAEQQLIYIEKLIKSNMNAFNGGQPFKSLTQYYLSNFLPSCLSRSDIKSENPNAIIASKDPTELHIPHTSINFEKRVYNSNSGLDVDHDGNITYGDITKMLANVANRNTYKSQLDFLKTHTGYEETKSSKVITDPKVLSVKQDAIEQSVSDKITSLLDNILDNIRASEKKYKKLYKTLLPTHDFIIKVNADNKTNVLEFCRILSSALEEELLATAYTHKNDNEIEIQCSIQGPLKLCHKTIEQFSNVFSGIFCKYANIDMIDTNVIINRRSDLPILTADEALDNYRSFLIQRNS
jgi:hypothetical protein